MGFLANAYNVFKIGFDNLKQKNTFDQIFGLGRKYRINQNRRDVPFEQGYAKSGDVYSIVNKLVSNAITVPWVLKLQTGDDIATVTEGELFDLIKNPNPAQSRQTYTEQGLNQLLLGGDVFQTSLIPVGSMFGGKPAETYLLHPQLVNIETMLEGRFIIPKRYEYALMGKTFKIPTEEITHLKYCNPTEFGIQTLYGLSPLTAGALTMIGLNNNQTAQAAILEHQGAAGILSNESEYFLTDKEKDKQQKVLDNEIAGAELFGKVVQSRAKIKYTKLGLDPAALEIIKSKLLMMRDICNIYDVRSMLFNDLVGATFNNVKEAEKQMWEGPIKSNLELFVNSFEKEVVTKFNKADFPDGQSKYFIELDFSGIQVLQEDKLKEAQKDKVVMEGMKILLEMPISTEAKAKILEDAFSMPTDLAEAMVAPPGTKNEILEKLKALRPQLANQIINKMGEDEVRALLN